MIHFGKQGINIQPVLRDVFHGCGLQIFAWGIIIYIFALVSSLMPAPFDMHSPMYKLGTICIVMTVGECKCMCAHFGCQFSRSQFYKWLTGPILTDLAITSYHSDA